MGKQDSPIGKLLTRIGEDTNAGLFLRASLIVVVQLLVLLGLLLLIQLGVFRCSIGDLILVFGMMVLCQVVGQLIAERPQGVDWVTLRLFGSLAVRTFFPLAIIFIADITSEGGFVNQVLIPVFVFYFVGLVLSSAQHLMKLNDDEESIGTETSSRNSSAST